MLVVARQDDNLTGPDHNRRLTEDLQQELAGADIVVGDDGARLRNERIAVLRPDPGGHAPRRGELGIEKDASGKPRGMKDVEDRVHGCVSRRFGGSGKRSGVSPILHKVIRA